MLYIVQHDNRVGRNTCSVCGSYRSVTNTCHAHISICTLKIYYACGIEYGIVIVSTMHIEIPRIHQ